MQAEVPSRLVKKAANSLAANNSNQAQYNYAYAA